MRSPRRSDRQIKSTGVFRRFPKPARRCANRATASQRRKGRSGRTGPRFRHAGTSVGRVHWSRTTQTDPGHPPADRPLKSPTPGRSTRWEARRRRRRDPPNRLAIDPTQSLASASRPAPLLKAAARRATGREGGFPPAGAASLGAQEATTARRTKPITGRHRGHLLIPLLLADPLVLSSRQDLEDVVPPPIVVATVADV